MDYAFAPGVDSAINSNREALKRRPATFVFDASGVTNVAEFLFSANITSAVLGPGDLFAAGHGSAEGELFLTLDSTLPALTTFESVVTARASGSIKIPANLNTGQQNFCLTSCLLGSDHCRPLLIMLKMALGNPNSVSAPKFLHGFQHGSNGVDLFEWMLYDFWIVGNDSGKKPLATRAEAVSKFGTGTFKFFDGTDVPVDRWDHWIPPQAQLALDSTVIVEATFAFPVTLPFPGHHKEIIDGHWLSEPDWITFTIDTNVVPVGQDVIVDTLRTELPNKLDFASHLYPVYRRHHFNTLEDFIQGWNWQVTPSNNTLKFVGMRYTYHLWIPITNPATADELISNYYPPSGNAVITFTPTSHPRLFGIV